MTSTDQCPQPDLRIYGSIKSRGEKERERGGEADDISCQQGLFPWLVGWLAAAIYGSRHRRGYFCLPLSLESKKNLSVERGRYCVSYLQLFCPERETMQVYFCKVALLMSWAVRGASAGAITGLLLVAALKDAVCVPMLGFILSERVNVQSAFLLCSPLGVHICIPQPSHTPLLLSAFGLSTYLNFLYLHLFLSPSLPLSPHHPRHTGGVWLWPAYAH